MNAKKEQTAKEALIKAAKACKILTKLVDLEIDDALKNQNINWGHTGTMNHCRTQLLESYQCLSGLDMDQITKVLGAAENNQDVISYEGFVITIEQVTSRFGVLFIATNDIGEPYMDIPAYSDRQAAIDTAKKDIDDYVSDQMKGDAADFEADCR